MSHLSGLVGLLLFICPVFLDAAHANDRVVLYPKADPADTGRGLDWIKEIETRIPPLENDLNGRWPLVLWRIIEPERITPDSAAMLLARGLVPSLPMTESAIPAAHIIQEAGAPVVLTAGSGAGAAWPYTLQPDKKDWAYKFGHAEVPDTWRGTPVPTLFSGWAAASERIRQVLRAFKSEGVEVDAAWLDYESLPVLSDYDIATASTNGRSLLPAVSLENRDNFSRYTRQLWTNLLSAYIAAPIREVFPRVSVTNWGTLISLPEFPVLNWRNQPLPLVGPTLFTASNPVAYGIDTAFKASAKLNAMTTQIDVDRIYTEILLRQVSADAYARHRLAPELGSVVWIARWVKDNTRRSTPMMSRSAYREALRHLWLRGTDAMQIFAPVRPGFADTAIEEVEDAVSVLDEISGYSALLENGKVMNYTHSVNRTSLVLWSGLRHGNDAIVRATSFSGRTETINIPVWETQAVSLKAPALGATYRVLFDPSDHVVRVKNTESTR